MPGWIELHGSAIVHAQRHAAFGDALDGAQLAVRNLQVVCGRGELDAVSQIDTDGQWLTFCLFFVATDDFMALLLQVGCLRRQLSWRPAFSSNRVARWIKPPCYFQAPTARLKSCPSQK